MMVLVSSTATAADWQSEYGRLLAKYVNGSVVRYADWKNNPQDVKAIQAVVEGIAAAPASSARSKEQLALHINAYNAWILHEVLARYPVKTIKDALFTFFTEADRRRRREDELQPS